MDDYTIPILGGGSHHPAAGRRCAMEHLSWVLGQQHTDRPETAWVGATTLVQDVNDEVANAVGVLVEYEHRVRPNCRPVVLVDREIPAEFAERLVALAWLTVGTRDAFDVLAELRRPLYRQEVGNMLRVPLDRLRTDMGRELMDSQCSGQHDPKALAHDWLDRATALLQDLRRALHLPETVQSIYPTQSITIAKEVVAV